MIKLKSKIIISAIMVFALGIITMQLSVYASNEKIEIVQKSTNDYIIYIKDNLNKNFQFAFSNNKNEEKSNLSFKKAETDSIEENANKIAYVNTTTIEMFKNPTYMWVKDEKGNYILESVEIDLKDSLSEETLKNISNITKVIPIKTEQSTTTKKDENGKKLTTTVGKVILPETKESYEYALIKTSESNDYKELMNLATKISKFNNNTDMYTKVSVYKKVNTLISKLVPENWIQLEGNEISQPINTVDGEEYILLINEKNGNESKQDFQFLTSYREESQEKIMEKITTKLPVTYDNNILLVVLAVLIAIAILVYIRIKTLNKKEKKD